MILGLPFQWKMDVIGAEIFRVPQNQNTTGNRWTVPRNVTNALIICISRGGNNNGSYLGGGGGCAISYVSLTPGQVLEWGINANTNGGWSYVLDSIGGSPLCAVQGGYDAGSSYHGPATAVSTSTGNILVRAGTAGNTGRGGAPFTVSTNGQGCYLSATSASVGYYGAGQGNSAGGTIGIYYGQRVVKTGWSSPPTKQLYA